MKFLPVLLAFLLLSCSEPTDGIEIQISNYNFEETYSRLRNAIDTNPNLRIIAEIDHSANATGAGLDLSPTRLILFGNPNAGTPLMQAGQSIAIDLPQKMLVFEDKNSSVHVAYNNINWLTQRHGIEGQDARVENIATLLANLATTATSE